MFWFFVWFFGLVCLCFLKQDVSKEMRQTEIVEEENQSMIQLSWPGSVNPRSSTLNHYAPTKEAQSSQTRPGGYVNHQLCPIS